MTKKSENDQQQEWGNRLAFLGGISSRPENSILADEGEDEEELVPAPTAAPRRRRRRPLTPAKAKLARRRAAVKKKKVTPPKESVSARARTEVRRLVDQLRDEVIRKGMPGIALNLYRSARVFINDLEPDADDYEKQRAKWALQAAIEAFELAERYADAADVLIFTARWALRMQPAYDDNVKYLIDQARAYLDPSQDQKQLAECDELELLYGAKRSQK